MAVSYSRSCYPLMPPQFPDKSFRREIIAVILRDILFILEFLVPHGAAFRSFVTDVWLRVVLHPVTGIGRLMIWTASVFCRICRRLGLKSRLEKWSSALRPRSSLEEQLS